MTEEKLTFEQALRKLDEVVNHLEQGDRPLDESLALFEEGARLVKQCSNMLDSAEQKVAQLKKDMNGEPTEEKYESD